MATIRLVGVLLARRLWVTRPRREVLRPGPLTAPMLFAGALRLIGNGWRRLRRGLNRRLILTRRVGRPCKLLVLMIIVPSLPAAAVAIAPAA